MNYFKDFFAGIVGIMISGKPSLSLKDHLVSTQFKPPKCHKTCLSCSKTAPDCCTKCDTRLFVYALTCIVCGEQYIGQSCRFPHTRIYEHCQSLKNQEDDKSIATHFLEDHQDLDNKMHDFDFKILKYCKDYLEMIIIEAELIKKYDPAINKYMGKWNLLN